MIRKAKKDNAKKISRLIEKNLKSNSGNKRQGFIRCPRNATQVKHIIEKSIIALVYIQKKQIIGFMNAYPQKKLKKKKINWNIKKAKRLYFDKKQSATAFLGVIDPKHLHQGIGSQLFEKLFKELQKQGYKYLFGSITTKPITNKASLNFIKKYNFKKVATTKIKKKPNTQTAIFLKKL